MTITLTTFVPGTKAKADEVNTNFTTLKDAINEKAAMNGDNTQTFSVANATTDEHAVNKGQLDTLSIDLMNEINKSGMKFCVKSGNTTDGEGDLFSYNLLEVTPLIAGTYDDLIIMDYEGTQTTISTTPDSLDLTGNPDGEYNIFINPTGHLYILDNTIYRQTDRPSMVVNDVWLDTSVDPLNCIKYSGTSDVEFLDVPLGKVTIASSTISAIETFAFNQNGYDVTMPVLNTILNDTSGYRFPDYSSGVSKSGGTTYTAGSDGWLFIESKIYNGGNLYCQINSSLTFLVNNENYSSDCSGGLATIPLCKGDTYYTYSTGSIIYLNIVFYPTKGV